ncbi:MAG TPA: tyrosine-type recombinase/integrase [Polyangia bacterium]
MQVGVASERQLVMPVRCDNGTWRFRKVVHLPDGTKHRISGTPPINKKWAAEKEEESRVFLLFQSATNPEPKKEVPTFEEWFLGRYMREWCEAQQNKPGTVAEKKSIFEHHLRGYLGPLRLDAIDVGVIQGLKAALSKKGNRYDKPLSLKTRNNILAVVSNALKYAEEVGLIKEAPRIRQYKFERPEIECWDFEEWTRLLDTARREGDALSVAVLLAGDAGLRLGEVLGLRWTDVDLVAGRLTVTQQRRKGVEGTPKSGRRRTVPMTAALMGALKALPQVRVGRVVCSGRGEPVAEAALKHGIYRVCRRAGLRERSWHALRHTFATHAARFGVNPWRLQAWLGHSTINMTMTYVHHVEEHHRPVPASVLAAGATVADPDGRVIAMLSARSGELRGNAVATKLSV